MSTPLKCRSCEGASPEVFLRLGPMPLANALLCAEDLSRPEPRFALDVAFCPACALVQVTECVPPERLFREYLYFSSFSETMLEHARALVEEMIGARALGSHSLVLEIASNDGYLLRNYVARGIPVLGIEPARNIARVAVKNGVPTLDEFFTRELAEDLVAQGMRADVIHAHNVLAHVPDLNGFVGGIARVLKPEGVAVIEVPYVGDLIEKCEFDTIYHEHLCYFSLTALKQLISRHGLVLAAARRVPIHGGSLQLRVTSASDADLGAEVTELLEDERRLLMDTLEPYRAFAARVECVRASLAKLLGNLKREGKRLAAYGAAAKGATLLNYCGIGREVLDFVVDRSTHKQAHFMPGVHVPIYDPAKLLEARPDFVLLLTWNFAQEILEQQAEFRRHGGRFILPVPEPRIVG